MNIDLISNYWYLWLIGLIISPLLAILPQLKHLRKMMAENSKGMPGDFFKPGLFAMLIVFGVLTFIFFVLFLISLIISIVLGFSS